MSGNHDGSVSWRHRFAEDKRFDSKVFYIPYFAELKRKKYEEVFVRLILQPLKNPDNTEWLKKNILEIEKFFEWDKSFPWHVLK